MPYIRWIAKVALGIMIIIAASSHRTYADTIFSDDFSGSYPGAWSIGHDGGGGSYAWAWPNDYAHEYSNPSGGQYYYPNDLHVFMERRSVSLSGYTEAKLSFYYIVDTEATYDYFTVNVRDQSRSWHELFRKSGVKDPLDWTYKEIDLGQFAGQTGLYVQFRFDSDGSIRGDPYDGVFIDNVSLTASGQALTATIYNAWWSNTVDEDGDGYVRSARLNWDPDVSGGSGSLTVYEKIYWKLKSSSTWNLITTTSSHIITGTTTSDSQYRNYNGGSHNQYDWKIEIYRSGQSSPDYTRDPSNDSDLNDYKMETAAEDVVSPTISNLSPSKASAGTETEVTITGTGFGASKGTSKVEFFYKSGEPKIDAPVVSWSDTEIVCKVPIGTINGYPASASSGAVTVTTANGTSNDYVYRITYSYGGAKWVNLLGSPIVKYRVNENTSDCTGEAAALRATESTWNNAGAAFAFKYTGSHDNTTTGFNLHNDIMWGSLPSNVPASAIAYAWINAPLGIMLECDILFNDSLTWSTSSSPGSGQIDVQTIGLHELGHWLNLRDLYGDIGDDEYDRAKVMYGFGSSGSTKRDLHPDDLAGIRWIYGESDLRATIWDAWWNNEVDEDGDGYVRSARLNWDPDVSGGSGSLTVYEKIYWKLKSRSTWNLITTTSPHTITGTATSDIQYRNYNGGSHDEYDWKIEIYRSGVASVDYTRDPSSDDDLDEYSMETTQEDLPTVTVTATDSTASEPGSNTGTYRILRTGGTASSLSVYFTMSGTATNGTDYNTISSPKTIPAGSSYVDVTLTPKDDSTYEGDETSVLTISTNSAYDRGSPYSATVTIQDDDPHDSTPPPAPTISSSTHPNQNNWYSNDDPTFNWTTPSDTSGIAGYSYVLDNSSSTTPNTTVDTIGNSKSYSNLSNGTWYFHVRAKDNAGNWGPADHYRVKIDDASPSDPTRVDSTSHVIQQWSDDPTIDMVWSGATDGHSGVHGYSYQFSQSPSTIPDATEDTQGSTATSPPLSDGNNWYFHIRSLLYRLHYTGDKPHS